jgi:hypothetical protein
MGMNKNLLKSIISKYCGYLKISKYCGYLKISRLYNQGNAFDPSPVHVGFLVDEVTMGYTHSRRKNVAFWDARKTTFRKRLLVSSYVCLSVPTQLGHHLKDPRDVFISGINHA